MMRIAWLLPFTLLVVGCASTPEYVGPVATITDRSEVEDATTMQKFSIVEMPKENLLPSQCGSGHFAKGVAVPALCIGTRIAARPMLVKIRGAHITDTPAQEAARRSKGRFYSVEGVVEFSPVDGGSYAVTGELKKGHAAVWIEDVMTKQPATKVIVQE